MLPTKITTSVKFVGTDTHKTVQKCQGTSNSVQYISLFKHTMFHLKRNPVCNSRPVRKLWHQHNTTNELFLMRMNLQNSSSAENGHLFSGHRKLLSRGCSCADVKNAFTSTYAFMERCLLLFLPRSRTENVACERERSASIDYNSINVVVSAGEGMRPGCPTRKQIGWLACSLVSVGCHRNIPLLDFQLNTACFHLSWRHALRTQFPPEIVFYISKEF